jgi:acetyl esterase/lipase
MDETEIFVSGTPGDPFLVDLDRQPDEIIVLWPDGAPGGELVTLSEHYVERDNPFGLKDRAIRDVTNPTLSVFRADEPNGASVLIVPGGGYVHVVVEKEGFEGARYLNQFGYDVYVMNYRLPSQGWAAGPDTPLQDGQRALRVTRHAASRRGADPYKIIAMGFSAGGHLVGSLTQRYNADVYTPLDEIDQISARPDLSVLGYTVALMDSPYTHPGSQISLLGETPDQSDLEKYDLTTAPNPDGPHVFLFHALDDAAVPYENTLYLAKAYREAGIPAVFHSFETGGHGFGMRGLTGTPRASWPKLMMDWIEARFENQRDKR